MRADDARGLQPRPAGDASTSQSNATSGRISPVGTGERFVHGAHLGRRIGRPVELGDREATLHVDHLAEARDDRVDVEGRRRQHRARKQLQLHRRDVQHIGRAVVQLAHQQMRDRVGLVEGDRIGAARSGVTAASGKRTGMVISCLYPLRTRASVRDLAQGRPAFPTERARPCAARAGTARAIRPVAIRSPYDSRPKSSSSSPTTTTVPQTSWPRCLRYETTHEAVAAHDGAEAVRLADERRPDVAILDIDMPHMDGIAAAGAICARWPDDLPFMIAMTGGSRGDEARASGPLRPRADESRCPSTGSSR